MGRVETALAKGGSSQLGEKPVEGCLQGSAVWLLVRGCLRLEEQKPCQVDLRPELRRAGQDQKEVRPLQLLQPQREHPMIKKSIIDDLAFVDFYLGLDSHVGRGVGEQFPLLVTLYQGRLGLLYLLVVDIGAGRFRKLENPALQLRFFVPAVLSWTRVLHQVLDHVRTDRLGHFRHKLRFFDNFRLVISRAWSFGQLFEFQTLLLSSVDREGWEFLFQEGRVDVVGGGGNVRAGRLELRVRFRLAEFVNA